MEKYRQGYVRHGHRTLLEAARPHVVGGGPVNVYYWDSVGAGLLQDHTGDDCCAPEHARVVVCAACGEPPICKTNERRKGSTRLSST